MNTSAQRLPGIGQEGPAPVELADRWHAFARRTRWTIGICSHLRTALPVALVATVAVWSLTARLVLVALVAVAVCSPLSRRLTVAEGRNLLGAWWRYRWSSNAARVGLGADGESSTFEPPELRRVKVTPIGRVYVLRVSRLKVAEVESAADRLAAKWKAHHVLVTVPKPGFVQLDVIKRDPHEGVTAYRPDRPLATLQDGRPFAWIVGAGHALIGGSTGSGKSGIIAAIVASFADRPDVALLAVDLKRVEVAALRPRCSRVATTLDDTHALLSWLVETMEGRWLIMESRGIRQWVPTAADPWLVLLVDEFAAVAATDPLAADQKTAAQEATQRLGLVDALAARGRAAGIELLIATQSPGADLFGRTSIRSNLPRRVAARTVTADQSAVVLGVHGGGAEMIRADRPGTAVLVVPGLDGYPLARFAYLSDTAIEAMAARTAHRAPNLTGIDPDPHPANPTSEDSHNERSEAGAASTSTPGALSALDERGPVAGRHAAFTVRA